MAKAVSKRKPANGYKFAERLPKGEILEDISKKKWKLGLPIGQGGFGDIYSAKEAGSTGSSFPNVIKIEPHANGPLFVEMHFYMRNAKHADIEEFKKERGLKTFGMPLYLGSGSHEFKNEKYRFVVMEKFGTDLWKLFLENNRAFPAQTVFKLAIQILDVLEYIHRRGYVHADIKGANILMGVVKGTTNQAYLVDFGLATKFNMEKEFKPNPKKAHDGTIEYLSRDAHKGVQTRRGDLEILAYNLIQWLGCTLPWENNLKDPNVVHKSKEENMDSVPKMIKACFGHKSPPGAIVDYLNYLKSLKFDSDPDYKKIRKIFLSGVKDAGGSENSPLVFSLSKKTPQKRKSETGTDSSPKRKIKKGKTLKKPVERAIETSEEDNDPIGLKSDEDEDIIDKKKKKTDTGSSAKRNVNKGKILKKHIEDAIENVEEDDDSVINPKISKSDEDEDTDNGKNQAETDSSTKSKVNKSKTLKKHIEDAIEKLEEDDDSENSDFIINPKVSKLNENENRIDKRKRKNEADPVTSTKRRVNKGKTIKKHIEDAIEKLEDDGDSETSDSLINPNVSKSDEDEYEDLAGKCKKGEFDTNSSAERKFNKDKTLKKCIEDAIEKLEEDDDNEISDSPSQKGLSGEDDEDIIDKSYEEELPIKRKGPKNKDNDVPSIKRANLKKQKKINGTKNGEASLEKNKTDEDQNEVADPYEGYTDAMKEIMKKKLENGKPKGRKKKPLVENDNMEGYNDGMKEVAQKKKEKSTKRPIKTKPFSPPSTTNKIQSEDGLTRGGRLRTRKEVCYNDEFDSD